MVASSNLVAPTNKNRGLANQLTPFSLPSVRKVSDFYVVSEPIFDIPTGITFNVASNEVGWYLDLCFRLEI